VAAHRIFILFHTLSRFIDIWVTRMNSLAGYGVFCSFCSGKLYLMLDVLVAAVENTTAPRSMVSTILRVAGYRVFLSLAVLFSCSMSSVAEAIREVGSWQKTCRLQK
jgi:hypothetical protein